MPYTRKHFYSCIFSSLILLTACATPITQSPKASKEELQTEEIEQQRLVDEAATMGGVKRTWKSRPGMKKQFEKVAERIEEAGAAVCQELGLPKRDQRCYYYFETSRSREINASADGDTIIINLGMQRFVQSDNELAMVMAHELAHNMLGHIKASEQNAIVGGLIGALLDGAAASQGINMGGGLTRDGMQAGVLAYSSSFESEADYVGLYITARAGYRVNHAADLWRRMSLENPDGIYNSTTHPSNAERFVVLNKIAKEISLKRKSRAPLLPEVLPEAK